MLTESLIYFKFLVMLISYNNFVNIICNFQYFIFVVVSKAKPYQTFLSTTKGKLFYKKTNYLLVKYFIIDVFLKYYSKLKKVDIKLNSLRLIKLLV